MRSEKTKGIGFRILIGASLAAMLWLAIYCYGVLSRDVRAVRINHTQKDVLRLAGPPVYVRGVIPFICGERWMYGPKYDLVQAFDPRNPTFYHFHLRMFGPAKGDTVVEFNFDGVVTNVFKAP